MGLNGDGVELDHVAIVVRDMDRMIAFYREIIGLDLLRSGIVPNEAMERLSGAIGVRARFAFLGTGRSAKIELGEFMPGGDERAASESFNTVGIRHIAFNVPSISDVAERVSNGSYPNELRVEQITITATGASLKRGLMRDPEGNTIELIETASSMSSS